MSWLFSSVLSLSSVTFTQPPLAPNDTYEFEHNTAAQLVANGEIVSLNSALKTVEAYCKGQLIDVRLVQVSNTWFYAVQMQLSNGKQVYFELDASKDLTNSLSKPLSECTENETATR
ncbi:hypothetical protein G3R49_02860 [Shewanella sp. WXL01]|uniref:PepSY domain-containing protein n=1 Tax=Shewanella maritima TaxID=2520507 RepID=A0A411PFK3_9GAMM|nr:MULTISPECIES: hypothetical protein [Shewanella]NKF49521.1 hypothetical protein [Shewanella sp. WXL01]QBF82376.1 hypothetical protein EXU30_06445 [Shewanella maritima]